jgi:hypothetical protein
VETHIPSRTLCFFVVVSVFFPGAAGHVTKHPRGKKTPGSRCFICHFGVFRLILVFYPFASVFYWLAGVFHFVFFLSVVTLFFPRGYTIVVSVFFLRTFFGASRVSGLHAARWRRSDTIETSSWRPNHARSLWVRVADWYRGVCGCRCVALRPCGGVLRRGLAKCALQYFLSSAKNKTHM